MLGNTLRSWSGWMDPSTACTCECASWSVWFRWILSANQSTDRRRRLAILQLCHIRAALHCFLYIFTFNHSYYGRNHIFFSSTVIISEQRLHSVEILALTRRIEVRWIVVFTLGVRGGGYLCCHTLSYIVDSFTPCRESQWSGEWWAAATVWFSNAVCKLLHFESTNNIVIFWKISVVLWFFFSCCNVLTMLKNIIFIEHTVCYEQTRVRVCLLVRVVLLTTGPFDTAPVVLHTQHDVRWQMLWCMRGLDWCEW